MFLKQQTAHRISWRPCSGRMLSYRAVQQTMKVGISYQWHKTCLYSWNSAISQNGGGLWLSVVCRKRAVINEL